MKIFDVARREYIATAGTKGFMFGVLVVPALMIGLIILLPKLIDDKPTKFVGSIALVDRTGWVGEGGVTIGSMLKTAYLPETLAADYKRQKEGVKQQLGSQFGKAGEDAAEMVSDKLLGEVMEINIIHAAPDADLEALKDELKSGTTMDGSRLALVVIDREAVFGAVDDAEQEPEQESDAEQEQNQEQDPEQEPEPNQEEGGQEQEQDREEQEQKQVMYSAYEAYIKPKLDDRFQGPLRQKIASAVIKARVHAAGQDLGAITALTNVAQVTPIEVTPDGERDSLSGEQNIWMAMGFMMLLWMSVMNGGQFLMMTVIEEKSSRVMEVLLSAVSPRQLMTGKILGQMCVALTILGIYVTVGLVALKQFNFLYLVTGSNLGLLVIYFFIAFLLMGSLMAAIGSAVTEIMEAQSLLMPVMMVLMIPLLLFMPLTRNPNSVFSTIVSFIPPISPFAMVIRMAASEPIPTWQIPATIVVGALSVYVAIWATAKIFRIGVLMYGKPPNFRTLIKWVRMA